VQQLSTASGVVASATLQDSAVRVRIIPPLKTFVRHPATIRITKCDQLHFVNSLMNCLVGYPSDDAINSWPQDCTLLLTIVPTPWSAGVGL
jgi:hypothetical protein